MKLFCHKTLKLFCKVSFLCTKSCGEPDGQNSPTPCVATRQEKGILALAGFLDHSRRLFETTKRPHDFEGDRRYLASVSEFGHVAALCFFGVLFCFMFILGFINI